MVRKVTPQDKEMYLSLTEKFYQSDAVSHNIPLENRLNTWDEIIRSDEYADCYFVIKDGDVAGYMLLAYTFSQEAGGKTAWIEEIYILPEFRSMGLGSELFDFIKAEIEPDCARLRLEVEADNIRAKKLYKSLGFKQLEYEQMIRE
ncbi:MAG: GNAT family N-acetyltransferase [Acutalibacteraceae bacterium]